LRCKITFMQICVIGQNNFCLDKGRENYQKILKKKEGEGRSPLPLRIIY